MSSTCCCCCCCCCFVNVTTGSFILFALHWMMDGFFLALAKNNLFWTFSVLIFYGKAADCFLLHQLAVYVSFFFNCFSRLYYKSLFLVSVKSTEGNRKEEIDWIAFRCFLKCNPSAFQMTKNHPGCWMLTALCLDYLVKPIFFLGSSLSFSYCE